MSAPLSVEGFIGSIAIEGAGPFAAPTERFPVSPEFGDRIRKEWISFPARGHEQEDRPEYQLPEGDPARRCRPGEFTALHEPADEGGDSEGIGGDEHQASGEETGEAPQESGARFAGLPSEEIGPGLEMIEERCKNAGRERSDTDTFATVSLGGGSGGIG